MPLAVAFVLAAFCAAQPALGALYKWVDSNGRVVYSDQPPTGDVKVETISGPPPPANPNAPQELANKQMESRKQQTEAAASAKKAVQQRADAETAPGRVPGGPGRIDAAGGGPGPALHA